MSEIMNALLMLVLALNLFLLGSGRLGTMIRLVSLQGVLLGVMPLLLHGHLAWPSILMAVFAIALKGGVIPAIMRRALRDAKIKREVEPLVGFLPSILLGAVATAVSLLLSSQLAPSGGEGAFLIIPTAIATVIVGFLLLITRFKAISQVLGYLVLENGIYIFSLLLIEAIPMVVEMGMLLDLFVAVFVISIITNHINQAFSSMDTRNLVSLKEE